MGSTVLREKISRYVCGHLMLCITVSFAFSICLYFFMVYRLRSTLLFESGTLYPISEWKVFLFFSKPLLVLVPFVLIFTFAASYFISRNLGNEVTITTRNEGNGNQRKTNVKLLSEEEKTIFRIMMDTEGTIYQNDLTIKSGLPRYQVSRIISKFEDYGIIEKERFGMTNVITLNIDNINVD